MRSSSVRKPSPALVVAVIALVFAVSGIAIAAGPGGLFSKAQTKKVKNLARAEANKAIGQRAAGLSVAAAGNAGSLGGLPADAYARAQSEPWRVIGAPGQPQFVNGAVNYGAGFGSAGFYKDPLGLVHLRGFVAVLGSGGSTAFTLPPGYRPLEVRVMPGGNGAKAAQVQIGTDGTVSLTCATAGCNVGLDGLTFRAEQ